MSANRCLTLANETWSDIFSRLSLHDLASVSQISKMCQALAFPYLYRTVCLNAPEHLEALARRIESDVDEPLSLRARIRGIVLDRPRPKIAMFKQNLRPPSDFDDDNLDHLLKIVPKLPLLQHFAWEADLLPQNIQVIRALQAANLRSVEWWVGEWEEDVILEEYPESFLELLKFTDLTHLSLRVKQIPIIGFHTIFKQSIVACLITLPNLESLILDFRNSEGLGRGWSTEDIINALGNFAFPSLRTFRALGEPDAWDGLTRMSARNPVVSFFARHPHLHTVTLGWTYSNVYNCEDPGAFAALFPSIRHFEAPMVMCKAIMLSSQAQQLESMAMLDKVMGRNWEDNDLNTLEWFESMPGLRKWVINGEHDYGIAVDSLKGLLGIAPNLEELGTNVSLDEPAELLELLELVPKLRVLNLPFNTYAWLKAELEVSALEECVPALIEVCPLLQCISIPEHSEGSPYLVIGRESDGGLRIFKSATR